MLAVVGPPQGNNTLIQPVFLRHGRPRVFPGRGIAESTAGVGLVSAGKTGQTGKDHGNAAVDVSYQLKSPHYNFRFATQLEKALKYHRMEMACHLKIHLTNRLHGDSTKNFFWKCLLLFTK